MEVRRERERKCYVWIGVRPIQLKGAAFVEKVSGVLT